MASNAVGGAIMSCTLPMVTDGYQSYIRLRMLCLCLHPICARRTVMKHGVLFIILARCWALESDAEPLRAPSQVNGITQSIMCCGFKLKQLQ
jgi:hypothetical protein